MNGVQSLNRLLDILENVSGSGRPASLSEITKNTGLPKSTASRMLSVLEERGFVSREKETGKFSPGLSILSLAGSMLGSIDIVKTAHPFLQELTEKTAETVHLLAPLGNSAVYVDKIEYPNTIKLDSQVGKRVPLYCTAAGKALLAHRSPEEIKNYIKNTELRAYTRNTITSPELLEEELAKIRKKGCSIDNVEYEENVRCVGAPFRDHSGEVVGAISVSGPTIRVKQRDLPFMVEATIKASEKISGSLGYLPGEKNFNGGENARTD